METIKSREQIAVIIDWQVRVSQAAEVVEVKPMSLDRTRVRFMPVYLETGELAMVIPAVSMEAAEEIGRNIARHILSVGLWGTEIWDFDNFLASIEKLL